LDEVVNFVLQLLVVVETLAQRGGNLIVGTPAAKRVSRLSST